MKLIYRPQNQHLPNLAIGLDDFAGTGFFSREYIVSSLKVNKIKGSLGIGWGKFASQDTFKNPFTAISDRFAYRTTNTESGTPAFNEWFRGNASLFGGIEYSFSKINGLKLKIEYDPFNYNDFSANNRGDIIEELRKKDSDINFGITFPINKYVTIDTSFIKGNTINASFNISIPFKEDIQKKTAFKPEIVKNKTTESKFTFYDDLLFNLNKNELFLQTANIDENKKLDVSISTSKYRNHIRSSSYSAKIAYDVAKLHYIDLNQISITHVNAGIEQNKITYIANNFSKKNTPIEVVKRNTDFDSGDPFGYKTDEYQPIVLFPVIFSDLSPTVQSHIGNPEQFFFGGIDLQYITELQFSRNLILSTKLNIPVYGEFKDTISGPGSKLEHVRTDLVQYLKEDDLHITRMQLDYIWSPAKNLFSKISLGIFEEMYGGIGFETLYKPFEKDFYVGTELFNVKKRSFDQRFNFANYKTTTGHINMGYIFAAGVEVSLSYGRYLAKDDGYTLDISRRMKSGFKTGFYFTRTDVPKELFGEGSFDKGFYFQIPLDIFSNEYNGSYSTFKLSPLTRDGGAKLIFDKDLRGLMFNTSKNEITRQWEGFNN